MWTGGLGYYLFGDGLSGIDLNDGNHFTDFGVDDTKNYLKGLVFDHINVLKKFKDAAEDLTQATNATARETKEKAVKNIM